MRYVWCVFRNRGVTGISEGKIWFLSPYWITVFTYENRTGVFDGILYSEIPHQRQGCFLKRSRAFKKEQELFQKQQDVLMFFHSYCITWQNTLFFFQKFQSLRKRPVHRLFGWRICTIKSFSRKDLSAWQGKRCRIVWFSIGVRIHLYTFIDHGWKKELRSWRISVHQSVSRNADE